MVFFDELGENGDCFLFEFVVVADLADFVSRGFIHLVDAGGVIEVVLDTDGGIGLIVPSEVAILVRGGEVEERDLVWALFFLVVIGFEILQAVIQGGILFDDFDKFIFSECFVESFEMCRVMLWRSFGMNLSRRFRIFLFSIRS